MENKTFIILTVVLLLFQLYKSEILTYNSEICINTNNENFEKNFQFDDADETIELKDEWNRKIQFLDPKFYKFINKNSEFIYIFESASDDLKMNFANSSALKRLNRLEFNNFLIVDCTTCKNGTIYITSIPKSNVSIQQLTENKYDTLKVEQIFSNIYIFETQNNIDSISLFDSFEDYNEIYYTKYSSENMSPKDIHPMNPDKFKKIEKGELITLDKNSTYIIINKVLDYYFSSFEYFISPKEKLTQFIYLKENNEKHLYLDINSTGKYFTINTNHIKGTRLIRLSTKTKNSKITINDTYTLDKNNMYYELKKGLNYIFKVEEQNALIEFLYNFGNETSYYYIEENNRTLDNNLKVSILIKLEFSGDYIIKLDSNQSMPFGVSICGKKGKGNYHYYSFECLNDLKYVYSYEETIKKEKIQDIVPKECETYTLYINIERKFENQSINLTYYPTNTITHLIESHLNSANFSNTELLHNITYKYIVQGEDTYIFDLTIDNKYNKEMYFPIYIFSNNKSSYNGTHFELKNEEKNINKFVYINYYRNWPEGDAKIRIISHHAEHILTIIYSVSGALLAVFLVLSIIPIVIIIKKRKENKNNDIELLRD